MVETEASELDIQLCAYAGLTLRNLCPYAVPYFNPHPTKVFKAIFATKGLKNIEIRLESFYISLDTKGLFFHPNKQIYSYCIIIIYYDIIID